MSLWKCILGACGVKDHHSRMMEMREKTPYKQRGMSCMERRAWIDACIARNKREVPYTVMGGFTSDETIVIELDKDGRGEVSVNKVEVQLRTVFFLPNARLIKSIEFRNYGDVVSCYAYYWEKEEPVLCLPKPREFGWDDVNSNTCITCGKDGVNPNRVQCLRCG